LGCKITSDQNICQNSKKAKEPYDSFENIGLPVQYNQNQLTDYGRPTHNGTNNIKYVSFAIV
jgi:hypothetical protein